MPQYVIDQHGQFIKEVDGTTEDMLSQLDEGQSLVVLPPPRTSDYWNGTAWVAIGQQPKWHYAFDYSIKEWVDTRDLEQAKKDKWEAIKLARNKVEFSGFMYNGKKYDSDYISQGRILAAVVFNQPVTWTTQDNDVIELTAEEIHELAAAMATHVNQVHYRGRLARQAIDLSQSLNEVDAVIF